MEVGRTTARRRRLVRGGGRLASRRPRATSAAASLTRTGTRDARTAGWLVDAAPRATSAAASLTRTGTRTLGRPGGSSTQLRGRQAPLLRRQGRKRAGPRRVRSPGSRQYAGVKPDSSTPNADSSSMKTSPCRHRAVCPPVLGDRSLVRVRASHVSALVALAPGLVVHVGGARVALACPRIARRPACRARSHVCRRCTCARLGRSCPRSARSGPRHARTFACRRRR